VERGGTFPGQVGQAPVDRLLVREPVELGMATVHPERGTAWSSSPITSRTRRRPTWRLRCRRRASWLDGRGERTSHLAGRAVNGELKVLAAQELPHSLGLMYEEVTEHLGFRRASDEYKVMALAA
jgi:hypothetical protein